MIFFSISDPQGGCSTAAVIMKASLRHNQSSVIRFLVPQNTSLFCSGPSEKRRCCWSGGVRRHYQPFTPPIPLLFVRQGFGGRVTKPSQFLRLDRTSLSGPPESESFRKLLEIVQESMRNEGECDGVSHLPSAHKHTPWSSPTHLYSHSAFAQTRLAEG